jgi:hypothetical protein
MAENKYHLLGMIPQMAKLNVFERFSPHFVP